MAGRQDDMVGHFLHEISARHSTDKEECFIVGSVLLPRGRLAVVERINKCVKLFDLEARKLTGKVSFSLEPRDITAIGEDRLAVVFSNESYLDKNKQRPRDIDENQDDEDEQRQFKNKEVQFLQQLRVKPKLARSITLPLPGRSYTAVTCRGEKLYLLCEVPPSIQIFNFHGTLLRQINIENIKGRWLFEFPVSIAVSPDGANIYVGDWRNVVCLTTEGQKVWTFPRGFSLCGGMDVDKQGRVFVCGGDDPPIHILSSAGRPGTLLLDKEYPRTVAVGDGRMYLGGDNEILVFRLEAADSARQGDEGNGEFAGVEKGEEKNDEEIGETEDAVDSGEQDDDVCNAAENDKHENGNGEEEGKDSKETYYHKLLPQSKYVTNIDELTKWAIIVLIIALTIMFLISILSIFF